MDNKDDKPKGILKKTSSRRKEVHRSATFDEMNIIATLHPKEKDYGHDKIDEPKTPYNYEYQGGPSTSSPTFNPLELAAKIKAFSSSVPTVVEQREKEDRDRASQSSEKESPEEMQKRLEFEKKRKQHYNEFQAVKSIEKEEARAHSSKK